VPNAIQEKVENLKRNFRLSLLAYEEFSKMFRKLFACKDTTEDPPSKTPSKGSRKKNLAIPYTSQKLFEMCWTLFIAFKGEYPEMSGDFVNSINGLLCCMDCVFHNILYDNRRDLINSTFPGLPRNFFTASFDNNKMPTISVIDNLCNDTSSDAHKYILKIRRYITEKNLAGDFNTMLSIDNYDVNFKKLNDFYETYILSCGQFDERIYLSHPEFGSKFFGKSSTVQSNSQSRESFIPQTPLSGQDFSHHSANKLSPVSSYRQNVQKLQALHTGGGVVQPTNSLKELLICHSDTILDDLKARLDRMKEIFCTKMMPNGQDRFHIAEALYYRLLENIINSELKTHGRFDLFINDDLFNETLIILCLEIILFAYSLHKKLPTLLECFNLEAFNFYKLIEVAIRNNKDYFTNDIIKHLKAIEEQCLDSLVWVSGSTLWEKIEEQNGKLPASQDADAPLNSNDSPTNQSPKSLKLFFRKFYQLAHLRLKDLCKNLQFNNSTDLLQKIWTLFQYSITDHIGKTSI
jgi:retinoblastoma-like protein 1